MKLNQCKENLIENLKSTRNESGQYVDKIKKEISSYRGREEYKSITDFILDYLHSNDISYFTICSKESFNDFESENEGFVFVYTPLNDHSRGYMKKGDIVFCYRQGQFSSLEDALDKRGIYGVGMVLADPEEIYLSESGHNRWGVAIVLPFILKNHLELRNIQLNPTTINLTPYNGNRNDALQYIESEEHYSTLLSMIAMKNPELKESIEKLSNVDLKGVLPDDFWKGKKEASGSIKDEFAYFLRNCCKSTRSSNNTFTLGETSVNSYMQYIDVDKLFAYNKSKWSHISSMYDITDVKRVNLIAEKLLSDKDFLKYDKDKQYWPSGAIMYYACFIAAREHFGKIKTVAISFSGAPSTGKYLPYLTALRTKPFMLLAGISGTGKSRIVRELAKACWKDGDEEYGKNNPKNFCMVQVKPNWHDSSELIGYVSRINGEKYVVGPFLRFLAKAIQDPEIPYFLCLDEMNLAPVEQYFAEYLSVIESRKRNDDGSVTTDPIIPYENTEAYGTLIDQLFADDDERKVYKSETDGKRLTIPQNLFVVGTVNMDETTFSFSRKVLDRAMTIEMNEVDLHGGLEDNASEIGYIGNSIIGTAAEGKDVYVANKALCDEVIAYLDGVNEVLEGTPFKIAYRTRNEFMLYAVNRQLLDKDSQLWQTLDEMTSMKILSRIEGDSERTEKPLKALKDIVNKTIESTIPAAEDGEEKAKSITAAKIDEMLNKLKNTSYTSYWT